MAYTLAVVESDTAQVSVLSMVESDTALVSVLPFAGSELPAVFWGNVALERGKISFTVPGASSGTERAFGSGKVPG